jgi:hypothetical protein
MTDFLTLLDEFCINDKVCVYPSYNFNFKNIDRSTILDELSVNLNNIMSECNIKNDGIIVLLDLGKINTTGFDISLLKKIIIFYQNNYPDVLHKIIIYNYSFKFIWILNILKFLMDKDTYKKIIIDKNIGNTINSLINSN